jgi:tRNA modification GTPase
VEPQICFASHDARSWGRHHPRPSQLILYAPTKNALEDDCAESYLGGLVNSASDTIAAIATAPGEAGISIVRISGEQSLEVADKMLTCGKPLPSQRAAGTFVHGFIQSEGRDLDEVIALIYRAPHSYTREDVVEIQGHGGRMSATRILRAVLNNGVRLAEPGEFTKRAFLSGRIDLLQAEAVIDLVRAQSDRAAQAAIDQLEGRLSADVTRLYNALMNVAGDIERSLDFDEGDLPATAMQDITARLSSAASETERILGTWEEGRLLREGALVVISGKPNVGKSTLMNLLLGADRAIVADMPGTTRDTIEEHLVIDGVPLRLVDTAGLRETDSIVEREGVRRARASIAKADLNIHVIDASEPLCAEDREHVGSSDPGKCVVVLNKMDLGMLVQDADMANHLVMRCCLLNGTGAAEIREAISDKLHLQKGEPAQAVISERHRQLIQSALNGMNDARKLLADGDPANIAIVAQDLRLALESLGEIIGMSYSNTLLDNIFQRFCLGK